jgi:hypothetical protein
LRFRDVGKTCIILASGPTAGLCDTSLLPGWPVIAVNDGIYLYHQAGWLYAADWRWWDAHHEHVVQHSPRTELWSQDAKASQKYRLHHVEGVRGPGLSTEAGKIKLGGHIGNSGAQAMNLAVMFGAKRLILVGFDMKRIDGKAHYFGEHPPGLNRGDGWTNFVAQMGPMAAELYEAGVKVINTSPDTALPYFDKGNLPQALKAAKLCPEPSC